MSAKINISDPEIGLRASVDDRGGTEKRGLVVVTRPLKHFETLNQFFVNPAYGVEMNQDATFSGTPEKVHNGIDNILWTATAISGTWVFDSIAQFHTGAKSIDATATVNNSTAQISKGVDFDLSGYVALTGWIYISAWTDTGTKDIRVYGWRAGALVGIEVGLRDYISVITIGSWQKFRIPLPNMSLAGMTIDSIRIRTSSTPPGQPPDYYLDDIQIEETGDNLDFTIEALSKDVATHVRAIKMTLIDNYSGTVPGTYPTMPSLSYDKLLDATALTNGILFRIFQKGKVWQNLVFRQLSDFFNQSNINIENYGSDGTNSWLTILFSYCEPILLFKNYDDHIVFTIQDDVSALLQLRATALVTTEV